MSCYLIKSRLHGLVLDCEGGGKDGGKVIPWDQHGQENQLFYDDNSTGTIRSKAGNRVLEVQGGQLVVNQYRAGDQNQQWYRDGAFIRNKANPNNVLDILNNNKEKGAKVGVWPHGGGPNQSWEFPSAGGSAPSTGAVMGGGGGRRFYIVSEMNGKVVDIKGASANAGTPVCMYHKNSTPSDNQLWYMDGSGHIKSALNNMAFTNGAKGGELKMQNASDPRAQWRVEGNKIVNGAGESLDIRGENKSDGAELVSYDQKNQANQHWRLEYV